MSRSVKKTIVNPVAKPKSLKEEKKAFHGRMRAKQNTLIRAVRDVEDAEELVSVLPREVGDVADYDKLYCGEKDQVEDAQFMARLKTRNPDEMEKVSERMLAKLHAK